MNVCTCFPVENTTLYTWMVKHSREMHTQAESKLLAALASALQVDTEGGLY